MINGKKNVMFKKLKNEILSIRSNYVSMKWMEGGEVGWGMEYILCNKNRDI